MADETSRKPADTSFKQQRLSACRPIFTPIYVGLSFLLIGLPFVLIGRMVTMESAKIVELVNQYDGSGSDQTACQINSAGAGTSCSLSFTADADMNGPVYVYYQLSNFYQNHRRYVKSYYKTQLLGCKSGCPTADLNKACEPLAKNGSLTLNPCGLIASSLFNDKILLTSSQSITYDNIAWTSDANKYDQPDGFKSVLDNTRGASCLSGKNTGSKGYADCADALCKNAFGGDSKYYGCKAYKCDASTANYYGCTANNYYLFWYPDDDETQYLYESFPEVVSPMMGVNTDRFQVWMRTAALPKFRKLYAKINDDIKKGDTITFSVDANFDVSKFKGTKSLVLTTTTWFGGKNDFLGTCFMVVGTICLVFGVAFFIKNAASRRVLGDLTYLQ
jgi:hypothetical protein